MLLTIWNFTRLPIPGHLAPKPTLSDRFSLSSLRNQNLPTVEPSKFLVQPYIDFSTTLPSSCFKKITLIPHGESASDQAEPAIEGQNNQPGVGLQVKISIGATQGWKAIPVSEGSPWRLFLIKVSL